jgi:hypothetical protein
MIRRSNISRSRVAAVLIAAMAVSVTGLFGAPGATVKIISPAAGARVTGEIAVSATVNTSAAVSYVILVVDQARPCVTNSSPFRFQLDTRALSDGPHRVSVEVYDDFGMIASSKAITINVKNSSSPVVAQKAAPPRAMAKPAPTGAQQTATKPIASPPTSVVAGKGPGKPQVVGDAADQQVAASAAPTALGRGPMPEPSSVAAGAAPAARRPTAPAVSSYASVNAGVVTDLPPTPTPATTPPRPPAHTIMLDGQVVGFDVAPAVVNGKLHAGFRALFNATGARVAWIPEKRTARSVSPTLTVEVPVGSTTATVNGQTVDMGAMATVRDGRTMVPVRFFAEATGAALNWNSDTRIASITARTPVKSAQAQ